MRSSEAPLVDQAGQERSGSVRSDQVRVQWSIYLAGR
jgi:hypothetical protein